MLAHYPDNSTDFLDQVSEIAHTPCYYLTDLNKSDLAKSGISENLATKNCQSLDGHIAIDRHIQVSNLGSPNDINPKTGKPYRKTRSSLNVTTKYLTGPVAKSLEKGALFFWGLDPEALFFQGEIKPQTNWCQIKPDQPPNLFNTKKNSYAIAKYLTPTNKETKVFIPYPDRDSHIEFLDRIAKKSIKELTVYLTEGSKKALALQTWLEKTDQYAIVLSIPGIWNGAPNTNETDKYGNTIKRLLPEIDFLVNNYDCQFVIAFDKDEKIKTQKAVYKATKSLAKLLPNVSIAQWDSVEGKGIDDVLYNQGEDRLTEIFSSCIPWDIYRAKIAPPIEINEGDIVIEKAAKYLPSLKELTKKNDRILSAKVLAIKSPKGTGKTELIKQIVDHHKNNQVSVLNLSHLVQLSCNLCNRLGLITKHEIQTIDNKNSNELAKKEADLIGYGDTFDGLIKLNPANYKNKVIILDEVTQGIWHLLTSSTDVEKARALAIKNFNQILRQANQVIISDADLDSNTIELIEKIIFSDDRPDTIKIINTYQPPGYDFYTYDDMGKIITNLKIDLKRKPKNSCILLVSNSKSDIDGLAKQLTEYYPKLKTLKVTHETVHNPDHPAYNLFSKDGKLDNCINSYDLIMFSPVVATGVDITNKNIAKVYGLFSANTTSKELNSQFLRRVRSNVDRHVFFANKIATKLAGGLINPDRICQYNDSVVKFVLSAIYNGNTDGADMLWSHAPMRSYYAERLARINYDATNYRGVNLALLISEGNNINDVCGDLSDNDKQSKEDFKKGKKEFKETRVNDVLCANDITDKELNKLIEKRELTDNERNSKDKAVIAKAFVKDQSQLTFKEIEFYRKGLMPRLRLYYYANHIDILTLKASGKLKRKLDIHNQVWHDDIAIDHRMVISATLITEFKVLDYLKDDNLSNDHAGLIQLLDKCSQPQKRYNLRVYFGINIDQNTTPIQCYRQFLTRLGFKLSEVWHSNTGVHIYKVVDNCEGIDRDAILARWFDRDNQLELDRKELEAKRYVPNNVSTDNFEFVDMRSPINLNDSTIIDHSDINPLPDSSITSYKTYADDLDIRDNKEAYLAFSDWLGKTIVNVSTGIIDRILKWDGFDWLLESGKTVPAGLCGWALA